MKVSGVKVESFWPKLFAKTLGSRNMADLLSGGIGKDEKVQIVYINSSLSVFKKYISFQFLEKEEKIYE